MSEKKYDIFHEKYFVENFPVKKLRETGRNSTKVLVEKTNEYSAKVEYSFSIVSGETCCFCEIKEYNQEKRST